MTRIKLTETGIDEAVNEASAVLLRGGIVAYPTETFYAIGVKFDMPEPLKRLYELKKRPAEKAMPVIIGHRGLLSGVVSEEWLAHLPGQAQSLMESFWPGPLTMLFPAKKGLSEFLTAGTGMIAVRVPGESFALQLAKKAGFPFTATSANLSGMPPAVNAEEIMRSFGERLDLIVDGGQTPGGQPSTIVGVSGAGIRVVREGAILRREIEHCLHREALKGKIIKGMG